MSYKLFIPGPIAVSAKTMQAMTAAPIGHRSPDFVALYQSIQPRLQELFGTTDPVLLSTSSAWGIMEGALRNVCRKRVLNCMNGAFSDKWNDVANRNGLPATPLQFEWGQPVDPLAVRAELASGAYDAITLIHNETSCGCMSDLPALMAVIREFPDVISIVDTVSSFSVLDITKDELGIDIMITGSQKALALPPGLSLCAVSVRALQRAETQPNRGYYFDLIEFLQNHEKGMTPSTPNIPLIYALRSKLEDIFAEGRETRFERHARLNAKVRTTLREQGFELFPAEEFGSLSLNCFANTRRLDIGALNRRLKAEHALVIDGGYGKIKGKTFRISNMGDETDESIQIMLDAVVATMAATPTLEGE